MGSTMMFITALMLVISAVATSAVARTHIYQPYAGIDKEIQMDQDVETALSDLNRYHGSGGYSYYPSHHHSSSYYRPSYSQSYYTPSYSQPNYRPSSNLGNILTPVVFGLSAATGLAAASSLFPSTSIVGK